MQQQRPLRLLVNRSGAVSFARASWQSSASALYTIADPRRDASLSQPYAVVNEARNDWRQMLWTKLLPLLSATSNSSSLADVFTLINGQLWKLLGR